MATEDKEAAAEGSGLYVDVENLHADGQVLIQRLIEDWPDQVPALWRLTLYVKADQVELWRLWAISRFAWLEVVVNGTQHFSMSATKNSADIAIATNAMADLVLRRISHVVVFSDDSDFISLYVAIRDEPAVPTVERKVPFLWVVTDRESSVSSMVKRFFPPDQMHLVSADGKDHAQPPEATVPPPSTETLPREVKATGVFLDMARTVVLGIEVGPFKSTECQGIIKENWPAHSMASAGGATFGAEFKNNIWPVLQRWGVRISNPGKNPVKYEMTEEAKDSANLKPASA